MRLKGKGKGCILDSNVLGDSVVLYALYALYSLYALYALGRSFRRSEMFCSASPKTATAEHCAPLHLRLGR